MRGKPRGAGQTPDNIGGRDLRISCFSANADVPPENRYGSVTRTETLIFERKTQNHRGQDGR